jgi:hypothetical protein
VHRESPFVRPFAGILEHQVAISGLIVRDVPNPAQGNNNDQD